MKANETYALITDLIRFREAYKVLIKDYAQSDCDFSEQYPLSPFDIMTDTNLENAIISWLNYHITTLYALLPERVVNPLCVDCLLEHKASAMTTQDGACKLNATCCANRPMIDANADSILYPGDSRVKIVPVSGLEGAETKALVVASVESNLVYGTDVEGSENAFKFWYDDKEDKFMLKVLFNAGVQVKFPDQVVLVTPA